MLDCKINKSRIFYIIIYLRVPLLTCWGEKKQESLSMYKAGKYVFD